MYIKKQLKIKNNPKRFLKKLERTKIGKSRE
jgi:hypothetical protein